jgi:protein SMG8
VLGLELAKLQYNELLPHHYSSLFHEQKLMQAIDVLTKYARGVDFDVSEEKLRDDCLSIWLNGKQQCEYLSLRGNPCVMGRHTVKDLTEHSSGVVYISSCNCGRTQGRREDPYTVRQANYEFYQTMGKSCPNCNKLEKVEFPIFEPSTTDFK